MDRTAHRSLRLNFRSISRRIGPPRMSATQEIKRIHRALIRYGSALPALALVLMGLAASQLTFAASYTITEFADDNIINGNCTLREAIHAANTNTAVDGCAAGSSTRTDIVTLLAGTYRLDQSDTPDDASALTGDLDIRGALEIVGVSSKHSVIDASSAAMAQERVFDIETNQQSVLLRRLTIAGGQAINAGGGNVRVSGTVVEAIEVEIRSGIADLGGGISLEAGASLTLDRSTVSDNEAENGGGLWVHPQATLFLNRSHVTANVASRFGGGITTFGVVSFNTATIADNIAQADGGGLYATGANGVDCEILFSAFERNQAGRGGGMFMFPQLCAVAQSAFLDNMAATDGGGVFTKYVW